MKEELLNKKVKDLSMDELKAFINECIQEHFLLTEMALARSDYEDKCEESLDKVYEHIAKICLFEDHPLLSQNINHWKDEIYSQLIRLASLKVKKDNHKQSIKKKVFTKVFVEYLFEPHWEDYTEIYRYFLDAVDSVGQNIGKRTYRQIADQNKDRIIEFIESLIPILAISEEDKQKTALRKLIDNF